MITWKRTLRTPSSERFLAFRERQEIAAVDLHYLADGTVAGTVVLLNSTPLKEAEIQPLLASLDEDFLPNVDLATGTLTYTVVMGQVLGNYEATTLPDQQTT